MAIFSFFYLVFETEGCYILQPKKVFNSFETSCQFNLLISAVQCIVNQLTGFSYECNVRCIWVQEG